MNLLNENKIHLNNWQIAFYKKADRVAFISLGGDWDENSQKFIELYFVNVTDPEWLNLFHQKAFNNLDTACDYLNSQYGSWETASKLKTEGGCSSCSAH